MLKKHNLLRYTRQCATFASSFNPSTGITPGNVHSTSSLSLHHDFSLARLLSPNTLPQKKTKLICTIGPASDDVKLLEQMIKKGLNIARINFSHDDHEIQFNKLCRIREAIKNAGAQGRVGIMLDTKGPEIRTGFLEKGKIDIKKDDIIRVTPDYDVKCNSEVIAISYASLLSHISVGQRILIADGNLALEVEHIDFPNNCVVTRSLNSFVLGEKKNVNLPGVQVDLPVITEKDMYDIQDFGVKHGVDYIALSFARGPNCVERCREVLGVEGQEIRVIPKIENEQGLENLVDIVKASDGIMMARGDLGKIWVILCEYL
jgi:pyruvate kinase